jgi:DNA-binding transcriptional ArsR family regulator
MTNWAELNEQERQDRLLSRIIRWDFLDPSEKRIRLFMTKAHFIAHIDAKRIVKEPRPTCEDLELFDDQLIEEEEFPADYVATPLPARLTHNQSTIAVYNYLIAHPRSVASQIHKATGYDDKTVGSALGRLKENGIVRVSGTTRHELNNRLTFVYEIIRIPPEDL